MDAIPRHCLENNIFFRLYDDMDLRMTSRGGKISFRFIEVPDFYTIDEKRYYAAGMKIEGLKVGTASLVTDHVLNIKLHEPVGAPCKLRNINFLIPPEADTSRVSVEVFNGNEVFVRAPIWEKSEKNDDVLSLYTNNNIHETKC